jgi:hypothetical protein
VSIGERAKNAKKTFEAKFSAKQAANYSNFYQIFGSLNFNIFDLNIFFLTQYAAKKLSAVWREGNSTA